MTANSQWSRQLQMNVVEYFLCNPINCKLDFDQSTNQWLLDDPLTELQPCMGDSYVTVVIFKKNLVRV
jgi:hypothetical protein